MSQNTIKFVFISNYINHHQIPFCNEMYRLLGKSFVFIQTEPMEEERIRMGWQSQEMPSYVKKYYEEPRECKQMIAEAKVVLFGGTDDESYIGDRLQKRKTVIRYSERLYKTGQWKAVSPRGLMRKYQDHTRYRKQEVYLLCAGAYVPSDFHIVRAYPGKMLRWGYFPETKKYDDLDGLMNGKQPGTILWAARFLDWKHPEIALRTAKWLKDNGYQFHMDIIGGGEEEPMVRRLFGEYQLTDCVTLHGYKTPAEVRSFMERADIYLTTSDRNEGWGAVVNEAMNSGCAVIGNHMIGAVPFLIRHGENGYIYKDGCEEQLFELVAGLLKNPQLCRKMGENALSTIKDVWNPENAALRLLTFCVAKDFLNRQDVAESLATDSQYFKEGPISPAPVISERKMYSVLTKSYQ